MPVTSPRPSRPGPLPVAHRTPPVSFGVVDRHLEPVSEPTGEDEDPFGGEPFDDEPMRPRAAWWRWVAILVAVALVVATPFAIVLSRLLD